MSKQEIDDINTLIDLHAQLVSYEKRGIITDHRGEIAKSLIELELLKKGHSLKGIPHLSPRNGYA